MIVAALLVSVLSTFESFATGMRAANASKPLTHEQVWLLNSSYTDQKHGVSFRYPSVWKAAQQFGYWPTALAGPNIEQPITGVAYEEGGFPRPRVIGPYTQTNLEGVGFVHAILPVSSALQCEASASAVADKPGHTSVTIANRSFSIYKTGAGGMSQSISGKLYVTYGAGVCYLFETGVATLSPGTSDDIQTLTPAQLRDIEAHLWKIMGTVRITVKK